MRIWTQEFMQGQSDAKLPAALMALVLVISTAICISGQKDKKSNLKKNSASSSADLAGKNYNRARDLIAVNNWAGAAEKLNYVIAEYPKSKYREPALYWLAYVYKQQGKYQKAVLLLSQLIDEFPQSIWGNDARSLRVELAARVGDTKIINEDLRNSNNEEIKLAALASLFQVDVEKGLGQAVEILNSPSATDNINLREAVIVLIGKYGGERSSSILLKIAQTESNSVIRAAALIGLKQYITEDVMTELVALVMKSDDNTVADTALYVITQQENQRASEALFHIVLSAELQETRKHAVNFLGKLKGGAAIDKLIYLFDGSQDIEVKRAILFTLSQTGSSTGQAKVFEISRLTENLGLREEGLLSLGRFGDADIIGRLIQLYDMEKREDVKLLILLSLSKSKQKNALRKLASVSQNEQSPGLRNKAVQFLKQRTDSEAKKNE